MDRRRVIFLDFDGVVTTPESDYVFVPELMTRLGRLLEETDACIVISSSRRCGTLEQTKESIVSPDNTHVRNHPFPYYDRIVGQTPFVITSVRGEQVAAYLEMHPEVERYVILDDERRFLPEQFKHLVFVDEETGLTDKDVERAEEILLNEKRN